MAKAALSSEGFVKYWCPGCVCMHVVPFKLAETNSDVAWIFNNDFDKPTLIPSVLVYSYKTLINSDLPSEELTKPENITVTPQCHSFVTNGQIKYLMDSTHRYSGMLVDMLDLEEEDGKKT
jgi:hypothetical protein